MSYTKLLAGSTIKDILCALSVEVQEWAPDQKLPGTKASWKPLAPRKPARHSFAAVIQVSVLISWGSFIMPYATPVTFLKLMANRRQRSRYAAIGTAGEPMVSGPKFYSYPLS